jgi:hypothetical protein
MGEASTRRQEDDGTGVEFAVFIGVKGFALALIVVGPRSFLQLRVRPPSEA